MELRVKALIYIGIVIATLIAYEPIRHNDFVSYDDTAYITQNPHIKEGLTQDSIVWAFTKSYAANWHPLTWLSHILDYQFFRLNPLGYHIINLLLHIASAMLLFKILSDTTKTIWTSAFVAAIFALHPVQVEAVAWAAERKTVLSGLFWLLTIAAYIHYAKRPRMGRYILLLLVYGLSIMTKPSVVTLPFVLLLLDYWPLGRTKWKWLIIEKIPLFAMSAALCAITFVSQQNSGAVMSFREIPLGIRITNIFISYMKYIGKTIWPSRLAVFYPPPSSGFSKTIAAVCALLLILITILCFYIGRRRKYVAVGWLWFIGILVPMIGLIQAGVQTMANRYMYISILGLLIIAAWSAKDFIANQPCRKTISAVLTVVILLSAIILTRIQVKHWQNSMTLFEYALKTTKDNAIAENRYGCALYEAGRLDEAVLHLSNAVIIDPTFADNRSNLGKIFFKQRKLDEAIACFNELINRKQASAETYYYLAVALSMQRKYEDAIKCFAKVIDLYPKYPGIHKRMGITLLAAEKADDAIGHFEEALRTNPNEAEVYVNLGLAYSKLGKYKLAIQNCTRAAELKPDSAYILNVFAWLLATAPDISVRDANKAIEIAQQACKLTEYKDAAILDTLAAAFAAGGRFNDAITTAEQAVNIAKAHSQENLISEIQNHIELYKAGRGYIQK